MFHLSEGEAKKRNKSLVCLDHFHNTYIWQIQLVCRRAAIISDCFRQIWQMSIKMTTINPSTNPVLHSQHAPSSNGPECCKGGE